MHSRSYVFKPRRRLKIIVYTHRTGMFSAVILLNVELLESCTPVALIQILHNTRRELMGNSVEQANGCWVSAKNIGGGLWGKRVRACDG
jgi:hypothetical protein